MHYWFFFSHAREDWEQSRFLGRFYEDLEKELAGREYLNPKDNLRHGFVDRENLQLMASWNDVLMDALQRSRTMVSVVSPTYVNKQFCGKEFWIFDRRRRQQVGTDGRFPDVMLPVIWIPSRHQLPTAITAAQFDNKELPEEYKEEGLLHLMKFKRTAKYIACVEAFAKILQRNGAKHSNIPEFPHVTGFEEVPNAFESSAKHKAKFIFVAGKRTEFQGLPIEECYSHSRSCYWRPFNPPAVETIGEIAESVTNETQFGYEELHPDEKMIERIHHCNEHDRVFMVVDPWSLTKSKYQQLLAPVDPIQEPQATVLAPLNRLDNLSAEERSTLDAAFAATFPKRTQNQSNLLRCAVSSVADLRSQISKALSAEHLRRLATTADEKPQTGALPLISASEKGASL